jgi:virginiamycin B lyase
MSAISCKTGQARTPVQLGTKGPGGDIAYGAGHVWTTFPNTPLSVTDAETGVVLRQWRGPGGDSIGVFDDALWLTDYSAGTISRYSVAAILSTVVG